MTIPGHLSKVKGFLFQSPTVVNLFTCLVKMKEICQQLSASAEPVEGHEPKGKVTHQRE